ncbi:MAG: transcription termination factor NusA [Dehalococcoidia bacterium]|nr:transcription termination factor NusA [Dehalococcoidia bacterium]
MKNELLIAITQLCAEKNLPKEIILDALEAALVSAYKRNFGGTQNITVKLLPNSGEAKIFAQKTVVEIVEDQRLEITLDEARKISSSAQIGETVEVETPGPQDFGRIAAQTAKQVVLQRLREAEREAVYEEFIDKEGDIISGVIQRIEPKQIVIDLGKVEAILPNPEQVPTEHYRLGQRIKVFLLEVHRSNKGPQVMVSRTHRNLLRRLFELEVPEIYNGLVELKSIAREAGSRSKVAVAARQEGVDPVGSCVGLRGIRIQNIVNELNGEKVDVVQWHPDSAIFVGNALSPAQVLSVDLAEDDKTANVVVPDRQLSLAIGKEGQNARLAAKLTGWRIDIKALSVSRAEKTERAARLAAMPTLEDLLGPLEVIELTQDTMGPPLEGSVGEGSVAEGEPIESLEAIVSAVAPELELPSEAVLEAEVPTVTVNEIIEVSTPLSVARIAPVRVIPREIPLVIPIAEPPKVVEKPQIRFAEEILTVAPSVERVDARGRRVGKGKKVETDDDAGKPKKAKRQRVYVEEVEEEGEEGAEGEYDYLKHTRR